MLVTIILCVLSTIVFCGCVRAALALVSLRFAPQAIAGSSFSVQARKIARNYAAGAFAVLAVVALGGAVRFYLDLFQQNY